MGFRRILPYDAANAHPAPPAAAAEARGSFRSHLFTGLSGDMT